jgi:predicted nuclease of predicted toxin-antitoxin system
MARYLIDANLPYRFAMWQGDDYVHVFNVGDNLPDSAIWNYARERALTIVTKDADFSDRVMLSEPPPRVIHLRVGNLRLRDLSSLLLSIWPRAAELSAQNRLVIVRPTLIECIA